MAMLMVMFVVAMATATFIENDFGRESAYSAVYDAWWFELIILLLAVNLIGQVIIYKLYRREKITVMLFHLAFIVMIAGAALTRYTGFEGTMHIREGDSEDKVFSAGKYIGYSVKNQDGKILAEKSEKFRYEYLTGGKYERVITAGDDEIRILLMQYIRNAAESLIEDPSGKPMVEIMTGQPEEGFRSIILAEGDSAIAGSLKINFGNNHDANIIINYDTSGFYAISDSEVIESEMMMSNRVVHPAGTRIRLTQMQVLSAGNSRIIIRKLFLNGIARLVPVDPGEQETGKNAMIFHVFTGNETKTVTLLESGEDYSFSTECRAADKIIEINAGSSIKKLPFSLKLNDFLIERYPGSNMPSGYKSDIILTDTLKGITMPYMIFMNNVLKYRGYRFYQASYDRDEKGTYLSVNHDVAGIYVTYSGYAILFLFIILSLFNSNSLFRRANIRYWHSPFTKYAGVFLIIFLMSGNIIAKGQQRFVPVRKVAEEAGRILIQDQKGRTEPLYTLSYDILRKVTGKNELKGLTPMQVFTGLWLDFEHWQNMPVIKVTNRELRKKTGIRGKLASFSDLVDFSKGGLYKIAGDVEAAYSRSPGERSRYDKDVIKVDERVNIVYMIYTGGFLRIFPLRDSINSWGNIEDALKNASGRNDSLFVQNAYRLLTSSLVSANMNGIRQAINSIYDYQRQYAGYKLPSQERIKVEIIYHRAKVFERLFPFYAMLGLITLFILLVLMVRGKGNGRLTGRIVFWFFAAGFAAHTAAYFMRWYISGHTPLSNGYESMIFISWVTMLAGFIFRKRSDFILPVTSFLAAMTLLVAHMSFMDPEITNLVPVLKSYWLTLHVSVITSSYAFLSLGAIIGLLVLLMLFFSNEKNILKIGPAIDNLTVINYRTLVIGLYLLTIGTFLGAIWANESWGRYWGWDPKETWSLITIIVYTFVIHSKMIQTLRNVFAFNLMALLAISSVLMTYFGVNYYLSGLHSYAGGDPIPVPGFVYAAVVIIILLTAFAYMKYQKWDKNSAQQR